MLQTEATLHTVILSRLIRHERWREIIASRVESPDCKVRSGCWSELHLGASPRHLEYPLPSLCTVDVLARLEEFGQLMTPAIEAVMRHRRSTGGGVLLSPCVPSRRRLLSSSSSGEAPSFLSLLASLSIPAKTWLLLYDNGVCGDPENLIFMCLPCDSKH